MNQKAGVLHFSKGVRLISIIWVCVTFNIQSLSYAVQSNQVSQFGITWTFDKNHEIGRFSNGDYWVVGSVTIVKIDPASTDISGRVINGSMINPSPKLGSTQGYDSTMYAQYAGSNSFDPVLNVARPGGRELSQENPLVVQPHSSLVSTISVTKPGNRPQIQTAAILTVMDAPVSQGYFRPPYCGSDKSVRYNKEQLNYSLLASLRPVPNTPGISTVERYFERPWLDYIPLWIGRYHHPVDNMPDYGREMSTKIGEGALMLHLNFSDQEKETLLVRYVQLGIDLYGIVKDGGNKDWVGSGGHGSARKWPILFAGLLLGDSDMKNIGAVSGDYLYTGDYGPGNVPPDYVHFGEDDQTFYVGKGDIYQPPYEKHSYHGKFTYYGHGNGGKHRDYIEYKEYHKGLPEWGITHTINRNVDGLDWDSAYRHWCTANSWAGFVLAAHIMKAEGLWNHNALFDYMDRFMEIQLRTVGTRDIERQTSWFTEAMWDAYRTEYGYVWTMTPVLKITANGGSVTKNVKGDTYYLGQQVTISAEPDEGYEFTGWSGDLMGSENPITIIIHADRYIVANFAVKK